VKRCTESSPARFHTAWPGVSKDYFLIPRIASFAAFATRNLTTVLPGILIRHNVGVRTEETLYLKKVDEEFFSG
jgi:hypothetical protein